MKDNNIESVKNAKQYLISCIANVTLPILVDTCDEVVYHPYFITQVGSYNSHHCYPGGLIIHTAEVVRFALEMIKLFPHANSIQSENVLIVAGIYHDFMKIKEYKPTIRLDVRGIETKEEEVYNKTSYRNLVRHVAGSHAAFLQSLNSYSFLTQRVPEELVIKIEHCILSQHGKLEYGSPIEPQILEAHILHTADVFSQKFGPEKNAPLNL